MKGINFNNILKKSIVCYLWIEGEPVIGTFVSDDYAGGSGIAFKSSICPNFIKQENAMFNETEKSGMTGFYSIISDFKIVEEPSGANKLLVSFDEGKTWHRVSVLTVEGVTLTDNGSILPTKR